MDDANANANTIANANTNANMNTNTTSDGREEEGPPRSLRRPVVGAAMGWEGGGGGDDDDDIDIALLGRGVEEEGGGRAGRHAWKIGLVPANCVGHARIICYFLAMEDDRRRFASSSGASGGGEPSTNAMMDRMDEDCLDDDNGDVTHHDPPAEGWRVFQEDRTSGKILTLVSGARTNNLGRASCLRISYE